MGIGNLEENARKRKERLKALREQREKPQDGPAAKQPDLKELPKPELKLRNYQTATENTKEKSMADSKTLSIDNNIGGLLKTNEPAPKESDDNVDIFNLAPRKPNWDLKRDNKTKMECLERRTQRAIAEIIRERLKNSMKDKSVSLSQVPDVSEEAYDSD